MRLDQQERHALKRAVADIDVDVFGFGSRIDDQARGGDIDILIFSDDEPFKLSRRVTVDFTTLNAKKRSTWWSCRARTARRSKNFFCEPFK